MTDWLLTVLAKAPSPGVAATSDEFLVSLALGTSPVRCCYMYNMHDGFLVTLALRPSP